jgi:hypothetical protein
LRPDVSRDPALDGSSRTLARYFDTGAFSIASLGAKQPGNAGRNLVRGPGYVNLDLSLFKEMRWQETLAVQVRIEAFNLTNSPHFANPNTDLSQAQFGAITQTIGTPRILQFGARIKF